MTRDFTWRDAGRTVVFRRGGVGAAAEERLAAAHGALEEAEDAVDRARAGAEGG